MLARLRREHAALHEESGEEDDDMVLDRDGCGTAKLRVSSVDGCCRSRARACTHAGAVAAVTPPPCLIIAVARRQRPIRPARRQQ